MGLPLGIKYLINDLYNCWYVYSRNITDNNVKLVSEFNNKSPSKDYAAPFMTVWLLNIARIIKATKLKKDDLEGFNFVDIGCERAVSTIYVKDKCNFKTVSGFDFEESLTISADSNIQSSNLNDKRILIFRADAARIILEPQKYFIYMFNPFSGDVLRPFLENNIEMFRATSSVLGYANCRELEMVKGFNPRKIVEIEGYKCAVVFF